MRALTVKQPWAHAIMHLGKNVENRSWSTTYRGRIAIHAGQSYDYQGGRALERMGYNMLTNMPGGFIVGTVDLVDCVSDRMASNHWAERGQWHWMLENPRPLADPIPCRGRLQLWEIPADVQAQLERMKA